MKNKECEDDMDIHKEISKIARLLNASVDVRYTTANSGGHAFKKGRDTVKVYDDPQKIKRFTAVLSGKDWDSGSLKTLLLFDERGQMKFQTGREDNTLGKPVEWNSLPSSLRNQITVKLSGKWE